jgi:hypothetical protein
MCPTPILERNKGIQFNIVPFQGGKPTIVSALGNNIDISSNYYAEVQPYIDGGKLKPVVVLGTERLKQLPQTPAISELGVKLPVYDLSPSEMEKWVDDAKRGMENALRANPLDVKEQYERQIKDLQEAYDEAMLELRARKKLQSLLGEDEK